MADTQWLTQAQYDLLASELKERVEVKRVEIARLIDAARQEGDLRENGGYHAARNEQSMNETRIQVLQEMLEHAEVGDTPADDGIVVRGATAEQIGDAAHAAGLRLHQLATHEATLEEAFLEATGLSEEFRGTHRPDEGGQR